MQSAAFPETAGQQFAEAVLAAALALPLVFAVSELRNSRLLRESVPPRAADSTSTPRSPTPPKLSAASPAPILARRNGHRLRVVNQSKAEVALTTTPKALDSVERTAPGSGSGGKADAARLDEAAAPRPAEVVGDQVQEQGQSE